MNSRPNVLIVCEHASDLFGGEAILPLRYFMLLSDRIENIYLLTHARVQNRLSSISGLKVHNIYYVPDTTMHIVLRRIGTKLPSRIAFATTGVLSHLLTQLYQRKIAKKIIKEKSIDIIHEVSPVSPRQPSMMFGLNVPIIIGPMNGGMDFPPAFSHMASAIEKKLYWFSRIFSNIYNLLLPGKFFASLLLVANQRTRDALPRFRLGKTEILVENGVLVERILDNNFLLDKYKNKDINVLYVGRLIDLKMVDVLISAINLCKNKRISLTVVGDGPLMDGLKEQSLSCSNDKVRFVGWVGHDKITDYYDNADIFALPSIRECGGAVVLEAMARGLPTIAVDWGGPADYLDEKTGFLIKPFSKNFIILEFARYFDLLASDSDLRRRLGNAAIDRVKQYFTWENKITIIMKYYNEMMK